MKHKLKLIWWFIVDNRNTFGTILLMILIALLYTLILRLIDNTDVIGWLK